MLMGAPNWMFQTDLPDDIISNSLRFDDGSSTYLNKTFGSSSNQRLWTFSAWVKKSTLDIDGYLLGVGTGSAPEFIKISNSSTDQLEYAYWNGSAYAYQVRATALFRDTTNWYHVVVAVDTAQGTASNRVKFYVNGTQLTDFSISSYPSEDADTQINHSVDTRIGSGIGGTYFDGYMADVNFIDGSALTPTSFGREVNGVWIPKDTSGLTFGTNGYRLQFKQTGTGTASASTIGADTANTNHFTSNNLASSDVVPDTPENNFCTLNPLYNITYSPGTLSEGNLRYDNSAWNQTAATFAFSSGKWYFEVRADSYDDSAEALTVGIREAGKRAYATYWHDSSWSNSLDGYVYGVNINGTTESKITGASSTSLSSNPDIVANSVIGIAIDLDSSTTSIKYNVDGGTFFTLFEDMEALTYHPAINSYQAQATINFGQDDTFAGAVSSNGITGGGGKFRYAPPAGYIALCSRNLSEPAFSANPTRPENADDHFNTKVYTGNGFPASGTQSITGVGFQSDFTWIKNRARSSYNHYIFDSIRGATKALRANLTNAENTESTSLTAFDSDGFSLGANNEVNYQNDSIVSWNWKANGGTTTTNDASATGVGTIDSVYQANTNAGFSIVTYTGTGSAGTLAHGLGTVPKIIIIKNRSSTQNWVVYHASNTSAPATDNLYLNLGNATDDEAGMFNDIAPTTTVFSIGTNANVNNNTESHVAYLFSEVEGYSKFGSYVGNGDVDGAFIYTGFKPAMIILKRSSDTGGWQILDNKRNTFNPVDNYLLPNLDNSEYDGSTLSPAINLDFVSNGIKLRTTEAVYNASGNTYMYMAFAEQPFKYSNAA